ncbi:MAG: hypothetical protein ACI9HE_003718 [Planctomycetota bacterium]
MLLHAIYQGYKSELVVEGGNRAFRQGRNVGGHGRVVLESGVPAPILMS